MIKQTLMAAATTAVLLISASATAQSQQDQLDARYDRVLAAGYKALFLCSAIANAARTGVTRTPESVMAWELAGIQSPLNEIIAELPYRIAWASDGMISHVEVSWDNTSKPRYARHDLGKGCRNLPPGADEPASDRWKTSYREVRLTATHPLVGGKLVSIGKLAVSQNYGEGTRTSSVIVQAHGRVLVHEIAEDFEDYGVPPQRTWSVAKSFAATLIGAAVYRGDIDAEASAELGESDDDPRRAITIDHLLRMASGRYSDTAGNRTDPLYYGGSTVEETALQWPLVHRPGTQYRYANNDTLAAVKAINASLDAHPPAEFFAKLGMHQTVAETDWQGDYILSSQVWSTALDMATLGQLYLDDGVLPNGERILPEGWVEYVSSPSGPQPEGRPFGYGAGFWLMNQSEGVPPDTFAGFGNRGQYLVIVPSRNIVIVRRGEDPVGSRFDIAAFTRDVLAALEE